jgi:glyoxylase-like metal-dependent hydrolase (beta-lactamase superfamily II)
MERRSFLQAAAGTLSGAISLGKRPFQIIGENDASVASTAQSAELAGRGDSRPFESPNFLFQPLAEGVYSAVVKPGSPAGSNAAIVIKEDWVLVVDTHLRPSAAREIICGITQITKLPVRFVVNTHFHNDHTQGNQAYFGVFPKGVEYVSHQNTLRDIVEKAVPRVHEEISRLPQEIYNLNRQMESVADEVQKQKLGAQLNDARSYLEELQNVNITLPTITFDSTLSLEGQRCVEMHYLGRGHTDGDVVLLLPQERVLMAGDLFLGPHIPYAADAHPSEWVETLRKIFQLDFDQIALGHTPPVRGEEARAQMLRLIAFMDDVVLQARELARRGKSLQQLIAAIDVSRYRSQFANWPTHGEPFIARAYTEALAEVRKPASARP